MSADSSDDVVASSLDVGPPTSFDDPIGSGARPAPTSLEDLSDLPIYTALSYLGAEGLAAVVS